MMVDSESTFTSLKKTLIVWILLVSSLITCVMTALSTYLDYVSEIQELEKGLIQIEKTSVPSIATNLWSVSTTNIKSQLRDIVGLPIILEAAVFDHEGAQVAHYRQTTRPDNLFEKSYPLYEPGNPDNVIGSFRLVGTKQYIFERLIRRTLVFFVTQAIKTFFVSFCMLIIFRYFVTSHILQISTFFRNRDYKNKQLQLKNRVKGTHNELDLLTEDINNMAAQVNQAAKSMTEVLERQKSVTINSARLASLGEMATSVAHEINNPMAIIVGNLHIINKLMTKETWDKDKIANASSKALETSTRITNIISGLKSYSRDTGEDPFVEEDLSNLVQHTLSLCSQRFSSNKISVHCAALEERITINCRPTEITQVILNLLNNSFDAIKDLEVKWVRLSYDSDGSKIRIKVIDSGPGVPEIVSNKIFDPFFSTKEVGKGTGLGLYISSNIVTAHGGRLFLGEDCENTCFVLELSCTSQNEQRSD